MKVSIKFCGHCAPHMDMWELSKQLQAALSDVEFSYYAMDPSPADVLLILNACRVGCATRPPFEGRVILVTPDEVDYVSVPPGELLTELIKKITQQ